MANMRDMFSRNEKEKISPELKRALSLLKLDGLAGLEERFLATTAFLKPWAQFRDSSLLFMDPRNAESNSTSRLDILWFYTQFDGSVRRHDPRAEKPGSHFEIDMSAWGPAECEKHLFAWLLQTFCVGKAYSPFGFEYFELRNICTAWQEVLIPIVKVVRASYSAKGRRYYGRLALFIEDRCPSRLAFPEGNIDLPEGVVTSPTPFRMVSRPSHLRGASQTVLTQKNYNEAEKELRNVYPQYGGLVERPRFRQNMDEWLEEQRVRASHRKTIARPKRVQYLPNQHTQAMEDLHNGDGSLPPKDSDRSRSPMKRCSDSLRHSFSMNVSNSRIGRAVPLTAVESTRPKTPDTPKAPMIPYGMYSYVPKVPKQEPKSPLHGVTRQIYVPDDTPEHMSKPTQLDMVCLEKLQGPGGTRLLPVPNLPRPQLPRHGVSEPSMYTSIRNSNPFLGGTPGGLEVMAQLQNAESDSSVYSPIGALSAIPQPPNDGRGNYDETVPNALLCADDLSSDIRHPSYEGNGYQEEISWTNLHARQVSASANSIGSDRTISKPRSRLPAPIKVPPPSVGQVRVASNDTYRSDSPPKPRAIPWPGESPPKPIAWPGFEDSPPPSPKVASAVTPPIPARSPERWTTKRGGRSEQLHRQDADSHEMIRIVSKENIRSALGGLSPESSLEDIRMQTAAHGKKAPSRVASPPRLETYNTHLFPRKDARGEGGSPW